MKIQFASDLHLEFPENREFLRNMPFRPEGEILVLAGDIVPIILTEQYADFFDYVSDNFSTTYWIPGNHEFYHSDLNNISWVLNRKIRDNVFLVNNTSVRTGNINLIFTTLWTSISPESRLQLLIGYSDFHHILTGGNTLTIENYNGMHKRSLEFLRKELDAIKKGITLVVTHHLPTFFNYPEKYKGNAWSEAFAVELSGFIEAARPDFWIFGHHHTNKGDFTIGKTRLLTNQLGYVMYNEHRGFSNCRVFEV